MNKNTTYSIPNSLIYNGANASLPKALFFFCKAQVKLKHIGTTVSFKKRRRFESFRVITIQKHTS